MNGYELSRRWFDFCLTTTEKIAPIHTALYLYCVEYCNRLGWKKTFGLPTEMAMTVLGVKNWKTYTKAYNDLVEWKFIKEVQKSKNQYSATVIAIVKNTKANGVADGEADTTALQKQMEKQTPEHCRSKCSSTVGIDKPIKPILNNINLLNNDGNTSSTEQVSCDDTVQEPIFENPLSEEKEKPLSPEDLEKEKSSTKKEKEFSMAAGDYDLFVDWFNETTKGVFGAIRKPLGNTRKKMIKARVAERGKKVFAEVITLSMESDFLKGDPGPFSATLDWIIKPTNFEKILSGNYKNKTNTGNGKGSKFNPEELARSVAEGIARANTPQEW